MPSLPWRIRKKKYSPSREMQKRGERMVEEWVIGFQEGVDSVKREYSKGTLETFDTLTGPVIRVDVIGSNRDAAGCDLDDA